MVRKADKDIRQSVASSEALKQVNKLAVNSIHPSLIFFDKAMSETSIKKAVSKLHGKETKEEKLHGFLLKLKETNELLVGGVP